MTISFNVAAIAAVIPSISVDLKLSDIVVSRMIPFYMIPYGVGALIYAPLTKYISYRRILGVSLLCYAVASFWCGAALSILPLLIGRVAAGLAGASAIPVGLMLIGQLFEKDVRGRLVGLFFSCSFVASIAGIMLSGMASWRWLFYVPAVLGAMTALTLFFFPTGLSRSVRGLSVNYWHAFQDVKIRDVFIFIFVISFLYHGIHKWFGVYLSRVYQLDKLTISFFFIWMAVSGALGQVGGGFLSDKKGRYAACLSGVLILSVASMLLYARYPLVVLGFVLGLIALGWTVGHNGVSTVLTDFPEERRPEIASLNSSVRFVSGGIGFFVSSFFVTKSFELTFLGVGVLMLICSVFLKRVIPE
ncbi:MAG: MFS transporter [Candidatus Omnitrophica bacterium]|nr:MFS transporter [Candidatus Omnitrophota bacterium]